MAGPFGLGGMLGGLGAPVGGQLGFAGEREKKESYIISQRELMAGQTEAEIQRAQNLIPVEGVIPQYQGTYSSPEQVQESMRSSMQQLGGDLQNPEVPKDDAWWKKALSKLEPLKYLDIPAELLVEAAIDPISMAFGNAQMSPLRGSAERTQFEAWKALFTKKDVVEGSGFWAELKGRGDLAADAFEKRPLKMQIAVGIGQALATGGAGAIAKGLAAGGAMSTRASLLAKTVRAGGMIIDPWEIPIRAAGKGIGVGLEATGLKAKRIPLKDPTGAAVDPVIEETFQKEISKVSLKQVRELSEQVGEVSELWKSSKSLVQEGEMFGREPRFQLEGGLNNVRMGGNIRNDTVISRVFERLGQKMPNQLHPILNRGNKIRAFIADRFDAGKKAMDDGDYDTAISEFGEMAAIQLQLNTGARPWEIGRLTGKSLWGEKGFLDRGMIRLTIGEAGSGKTRLQGAVDANEALTAVTLYKQALIGKFGGTSPLMDKRAFEGLGTRERKSDGGLISNILNKYTGDARYGFFGDIEAYDIRRQKATEMYLEGWEPIRIARMMGHHVEGDLGVTRNYIKATMYVGSDGIDNSRTNMRFELAKPPETLTGEALEKFNADVKAYKDVFKSFMKGGGKAPKGYNPGGVFDMLSIDLGEAFINPNSADGLERVLGFTDKSLWEAATLSVRGSDQVIDSGTLRIASQIAALEGLSKMAWQMKYAYDATEFQVSAISKTNAYDGMVKFAKFKNDKGVATHAASGAVQRNNPAMMQRAGFARLTNIEADRFGVPHGSVAFAGRHPDAEVASWGKKRLAQFSKESGLIDVFGDGSTEGSMKLWDEWAGAMNEERLANQALLDSTRHLKGKGNFTTHGALLNYVDIKSWELYKEWNSLEGFGRGMIDPKLETASTLIDSHLDIMMRNPSGHLGTKAGKASRNMFVAGQRQGKAKFLKEAQASNVFDGRVGGEGKVIGNIFTQKGTPKVKWGEAELNTLGEWLKLDSVVGLFNGSHLNNASSVRTIRAALKTIAENNPAMFGIKYAEWLGKGGADSKKFINEVADRIANNRHLWEHIDTVQRVNYDEIGAVIRGAPAGRPRRPNVPDTYNGKSSAEMGGVNPSQANMVEMMPGPEELKWFHKDTTAGKWFRRIVGPIVAGAWGGKALVARPIVKVLGARGRLYHNAGRQGALVEGHVNKIAVDSLGLKADLANEEMLRAGITSGQEFFSKIELLPVEKILDWEATIEARTKYRDLGTVFSKLRSVTREGYAGDNRVLNNSEAMRYLTQVDIVMERINPEDWGKYFNLTKDQEDALGHMKDILWQVDNQARGRGVDIVGTIADKGGEYLTNYMPRLYRLGEFGSATRSKIKGGQEGLLNAYAQFFEPRVQKDIVDVLAQAMEPGVSTNITRLGNSVLESFSSRMGQYTETMWKTAIDKETALMLEQSTEMAQALGPTFAKQIKELNALERLLNDRSAIEGVIDAGRVELLELSTTKLGGRELGYYAGLLKEEGTNSLLRARKIRNNIMDNILERRAEISGNWSTTAGKELGGIDWLPNSLNKLDLADQRALREHLEVVSGLLSPVEGMAKVFRRPTRYMKYFKASMDFGAPLIHGFNALIRMPNIGRLRKGDVSGALASQKAWLWGVKNMAKFFFAPETYSAYINDPVNYRIMAEAKDYVRLGHAEPLVGMDNADLLNATRAHVKNKMEPIFGKHAAFLGRFEDSFTGYLDVLRTELWKGMKPSVDDALIKRGITDLTADNPIVRRYYTDLGQVINKMSGVYDPELSLRTPFQGLVENSLLFFAPMYRRATYGVIADLFAKVATGGRSDKSGLKWKNSMQQLSGLAVAGLMMGELAEATGNTRGDFLDTDEDLAMRDENGNFALDLTARFGKFHTNEVQLGIGTAWWTAFRMSSEIAMHLTDNTTLAKQDDNPSWKDHWAFRMVRQRGRSQLAPLSGMFMDVITGRTFIGDPLRDGDENDWAAIAARVGQAGVPFWLDGALSNNDIGQVGVSMIGEFMGLQSYEISSYDKLSKARSYAIRNWNGEKTRKWRQEQERNGNKVSWLNASNIVKAEIDSGNVAVQGLLADHREEYGNKAFGDARLFSEYNELRASAELIAVQAMAVASQLFETGQINARELSVRINKSKYLRRETNNALLDTDKFASIAQYFVDIRNNAIENPISADDIGVGFAGDIVYDEWAFTVFPDDNRFYDESTGEYLWEARRLAEDKFWADGNNEYFKKYVTERRQKWLADLPTIKAFENAKDQLRDSGYWDIEERLWANNDKMRDKAKRFLQVDAFKREQLKDTDNDYKWIEKQITREREQIRKNDQNVDRILVTWYKYKPMHRSNYYLERDLQELHNRGAVTAPSNAFSVSPTGAISVDHTVQAVQ